MIVKNKQNLHFEQVLFHNTYYKKLHFEQVLFQFN